MINSSTASNYILLQGAMDSEIAVFLEMLEEERTENICDFTFHIGKLLGVDVIVVKTFQGMVNAGACTILAIEHFHPKLIINQGICGGHDRGLHRGDVILGETIINYGNVRITPAKDSRPLDGCELIGVEAICSQASSTVSFNDKTTLFYSDPNLLKKAQKISVQFIEDNPGVAVATGRIGSADVWTDRVDYIDQLHAKFQTSGEDMESAAVAQLCASYSIPFFSVRTISNTLVNQEDFDESTARTGQKFVAVLLSVEL